VEGDVGAGTAQGLAACLHGEQGGWTSPQLTPRRHCKLCCAVAPSHTTICGAAALPPTVSIPPSNCPPHTHPPTHTHPHPPQAAQALDDKDTWYRLGVEALRQGNFNIVEFSYQKTKSWERLSFLYLITGQLDKLRKMLKIAEMRGDVTGRFHNALYLGDVREQVRVLEEAGQLPLAYVAAACHGLEGDAARLREVGGAGKEGGPSVCRAEGSPPPGTTAHKQGVMASVSTTVPAATLCVATVPLQLLHLPLYGLTLYGLTKAHHAPPIHTPGCCRRSQRTPSRSCRSGRSSWCRRSRCCMTTTGRCSPSAKASLRRWQPRAPRQQQQQAGRQAQPPRPARQRQQQQWRRGRLMKGSWRRLGGAMSWTWAVARAAQQQQATASLVRGLSGGGGGFGHHVLLMQHPHSLVGLPSQVACVSTSSAVVACVSELCCL
jgi:hypothetical protein